MGAFARSVLWTECKVVWEERGSALTWLQTWLQTSLHPVNFYGAVCATLALTQQQTQTKTGAVCTGGRAQEAAFVRDKCSCRDAHACFREAECKVCVQAMTVYPFPHPHHKEQAVVVLDRHVHIKL
jgi:hypothetical protein